MPKITIDDQILEVPENISIFQACALAGVEVPHFCYHERLSVAGNCRMCLVELENGRKPVASCALPVQEGMVVKTNTPKIREARRSVMEFLLINHPLDCPICDQGGECDLQDQAMAYGMDRSRFSLTKRTVEEKNMGPLIKTEMTRCIQCTRCVRFMTEVAGVPDLGALGRGEDMEIVPTIEGGLSSELSANIVDLCPVGALTFKPTAFHARSWEYVSTPSIDIMDALGSSIRLDVRGNEVMRILPQENTNLNEEWLSNKARFIVDGLKNQRLDRPYVRNKNGDLCEATWDEALEVVAKKITESRKDRIGALAGDLACVESMQALKDLLNSMGCTHLDCRQDGSKLGSHGRASYLFNAQVAGIEKADALFIIASDPRKEAPVLNARIRKAWAKSALPIFVLGFDADWTYPVTHIGNAPGILDKLPKELVHSMKNAKNPMILVGQSATCHADGDVILGKILQLAHEWGCVRPHDHWNGFCVLHTAASRVGGLDIGFLPSAQGSLGTKEILEAGAKNDMDFVYLLGADEADIQKLKNTFVVYQGSHGDAGASVADVIFPGATFSEKEGTWVNTEGRVQQSCKATSPPHLARNDWEIIASLAHLCAHPLPYKNVKELRKHLEKIGQQFTPHAMALAQAGAPLPLEENLWDGRQSTPSQSGKKQTPFEPIIRDYYLTNVITRASRTMAMCSKDDMQRGQ